MLAVLALAPLMASTLVLERGTILPGYGRYLAVEDTVLDSVSGDVPQGGAAALLTNSTKPILIQFLDLDRVVGSGKRVKKATLEFVITAGDPKFVSARRVLAPWTEGPMNTVAGQLRGDDYGTRWAATYKNRRNGVDPIPWQKSSARGEADSEPISGASGVVQGDKLIISGLEGVVNTQLGRWFDNHGFLFELDNKGDFLSSNASEARPRLVLELEDTPLAISGPDLSVTLISRTPEYDRYDDREASTMADQDGVSVAMMDRVPNTATKKWPDEGEALTYTALVKNVGDKTADGFEAQWLDREAGLSIVAVEKKLEPGQETALQVKIPYRSSHTDHRVQPVSLRIFPKGQDARRGNDFLEIQQSGLALGITVTPEAAAKMGMPVEDWVQDQIRQWNDVTSRYSRYSFAPEGSLERVRVQELKVGPETPRNLALDGQIVVREPGDLTAAIGRVCGLSPMTTGGLRSGSITADGTRVKPSIDRFAGIGGGGDTRADAFLVPSMAFPYDLFYDLVSDPSRLDPGEALAATDVHALNSNLGRRRGYAGDYFYDVPGSVLVTLSDMGGKRLTNTEVTVYQMKNGSFAGTSPIATLTTGDQGSLVLPKRETQAGPGFFFATGHTPTANPFGRIDADFMNGALLFKATVNGVTEAGVLKLWQVLDSAARVRRPVALMALRLNVPSVPLATENLAQGKQCTVPEATDGDGTTSGNAPEVIELDLGQDYSIGEINVLTTGGGQWGYDVKVYASGEKPEAARMYAREGDLAWSRLCRSEEDSSIAYRSLPAKARYIRLVSTRPATEVKLAEIRVRAAK